MALIDVNTQIGPAPSAASDLNVEALRAQMEKNQVTVSIVVSSIGVLLDPSVGNALTLATCADHEDLRPAATLDPRAYFGDTELLERMRSRGYCMLRFFPQRQGWPIRYAPFAALTRDLASSGLPIMVEIAQRGEVTELEAAVDNYPSGIILAGVRLDTLAEAVSIIRAHATWHLELSSLLAPGAVKLLVDKIGGERLLFGSGAPAASAAAVLRTLDYSGLPTDIHQSILHLNAERLFGIRCGMPEAS